MRRLRVTWSLAALGIALLGVLAGGGPAVAAPRATCASGLAALQSGRLQRAATIYGAIRPPGSSCAQQGLTAIRALQRARQLLAVGLTAAADTQFERALEAEPTLSVPGDLLPRTVGHQGVVLAEALDREGFHDQAVEVLLQVIENDPEVRLDPAAQRILHPHHSFPWWGWHVATQPEAPVIALFLVVIALIVLASSRRRLHFQPFTGGEDAATGPDAPAILRALIRAEAHRLAEESVRLPDGRGLRLDQAGPYEDAFDRDAFTDGLPAVWKLLVGATGQLLREVGSRSRLVTGVLLPKTSVALAIETVHGNVDRMGVIEHAKLDFPDPDQDSLAQLALPAAAWIILARYPDITLGGTRQWASYVSFAAGYAWQSRNSADPADRAAELDKAKVLYRRACSDPANTAAAVNLAALEQLDDRTLGFGDPAGRPSYERLTTVLQLTGDDRRDLQWYRARYLLASGLRDILDEAPPTVTPADERDPDLRATLSQEAGEAAAALAKELEDQLSHPGQIPPEFAEHSRAAALTLAARQAIPQTSDVTEVVIPAGPASAGPADDTSGGQAGRRARRRPSAGGPDRMAAELRRDGPVLDEPEAQDLTESSLLDLLDSLQADHPHPGTSERLVDFVRDHLELDDQAQYNLLRYHLTRAKICREASRRYDVALQEAETTFHGTPPPYVTAWRNEVLAWQRLLDDQYQAEVAEAAGYEASVVAAGDPVLVAQVDSLPEHLRVQYPGDSDLDRPHSTSAERARGAYRAPAERPETPRESAPNTAIPNSAESPFYGEDQR